MSVEWVARHALVLWASLLVIAVIGGDLAWQRAARRRRRNTSLGRPHSALPPLPAAAIVLTLLLAFAALGAVVVHGNDRLFALDHQLAAQLKAELSAPALKVVDLLTQLGNPWLLGGLTLAVTAGLAWMRQGALALAWIVALGGTALVNTALKLAFRRDRPPHEAGLVSETSFSFPSGHASGAMVFYGMLAYVLLRLLPLRWHRPVIAWLVTAVTLVGVSRILLQVHFLSDVLAGYASGLAWLLLCIGTAEYLRLRASARHGRTAMA